MSEVSVDKLFSTFFKQKIMNNECFIKHKYKKEKSLFRFHIYVIHKFKLKRDFFFAYNNFVINLFIQ